MADDSSWRPAEGGPVALSDTDLAQIGLAVVLEAAAKGAAASALRVLEGLAVDEWIGLERAPFNEITKRLLKASVGVDGELEARVRDLEIARNSGHELRHIVVHVMWGQGGDQRPIGFDYGRQRLLTTSDIQGALEACAELKRAAHWAAYRVAELIVEGRFPERPDGQGLSLRTEIRSVRL